jgi:nitroreductase
MDVFEAMGTARAMRFFTPDPVPQELIDKVLWAATRASSPNNTQGWDFIVVTDPAVKSRIGDLFKPFAERVAKMPDPGNPTDRRTLAGAKNLGENMGNFPVIIFVCGRNVYPQPEPRETFMYSAIYAASQNLVVAARALGLGAAFTTLHGIVEPQLRELLGIPDEIFIGTTIPLGYPAGPTGPVTRKPVEEVVHLNGW